MKGKPKQWIVVLIVIIIIIIALIIGVVFYREHLKQQYIDKGNTLDDLKLAGYLGTFESVITDIELLQTLLKATT